MFFYHPPGFQYYDSLLVPIYILIHIFKSSDTLKTLIYYRPTTLLKLSNYAI